MASERLRVGKVEVRGSRFLSEGEVRELLGPAVGENILSLDIDALKARLRASPWVADATVSRTLPDTLRVEIHERVPAGPGRAGAALPDGRRRRAHRHLRPAHRRLRPAHRARACSGVGRRRPAASARSARAPCCGTSATWRRRSRRSRSRTRATCGSSCAGAGEVVRMGAPPYRTRLLTFLGCARS